MTAGSDVSRVSRARGKTRALLSFVALLALLLFFSCSARAYATNDAAANDGNVTDAGVTGAAAAGQDKYAAPPELTAESAILIDVKTGSVLFEKDADAKREPASCTKIMTGLLAIERLAPDDIVTVTQEASYAEGSSVGLVPDEEASVYNLLYAAMLESGNDSATALAVGVAGSVEGFAELMNERAAQIGLTRSHFTNPHGLNDPDHYTTARDLSLLAREAMKNETFRSYVSTYEYVMPETNLQPERILHNSNRMLYDKSKKVEVYGENVSVVYPGVTGIKTGYTRDAGNCLVSGVNRDGFELISVILKSQGMDQYSDTIALLEYGLHNFEEVTYMKKGETMSELPVAGGELEEVRLILSDDLVATLNRNDASLYVVDSEMTVTAGGIAAPVKAGDVFGQARLQAPDGRTLASADIVAAISVGNASENIETEEDEGVGALSFVLRAIGVACLIAVAVVVISIIRATVTRRRRRRKRMYGAVLNNSADPREVRRIKNINRTTRRRR